MLKSSARNAVDIHDRRRYVSVHDTFCIHSFFMISGMTETGWESNCIFTYQRKSNSHEHGTHQYSCSLQMIRQLYLHDLDNIRFLAMLLHRLFGEMMRLTTPKDQLEI